MQRRRYAWVLLLAAAAASLSCAETPTERRWEGEFVTLTSSEKVEPCGGMLTLLDRFVDHNYRYWAGDASSQNLGLELDLRLSDSQDVFAGKAFLDKRSAWAGAQYAVLHELSHLVVGATDGDSAPMLSEGIAEALGQADPSSQWGTLTYDPLDYVFLTNDEFMSSHYVASAQLIRFWTHRYGLEAVREAYIAAQPDHTSEEIEAALIGVFGDDLYDGLAEFAIGPQCPLQVWECGEAVLPVRTLPITVERTADCRGDAEFFGAVAEGDDLWYPMQQFVLELTEQTSFLVDTHDNASVRFTACVETCGQLPPHLEVVLLSEEAGFGRTTFEAMYPAGRYVVKVRPLDVSLPFSASFLTLP